VTIQANHVRTKSEAPSHPACPTAKSKNKVKPQTSQTFKKENALKFEAHPRLPLKFIRRTNQGAFKHCQMLSKFLLKFAKIPKLSVVKYYYEICEQFIKRNQRKLNRKSERAKSNHKRGFANAKWN